MSQQVNLTIGQDEVVLVTGARGMLGRAVHAELQQRGLHRVLTPSRRELDLLDGAGTRDYLARHRPTVVFHLASVVFGLLGNMQNQVRAISDSTLMNHHLLMAAADGGVRKLCFAASVACYPHPYPGLPLTEDMLWLGAPHGGEYGYAQAKRHALAYLEVLRAERGLDFFGALLTNLYGPHDRFDATSGHVIPSLINNLHRAKAQRQPFGVWGDGSARRDFMHVNDAAAALVLGTERLSGIANVCSGQTTPICRVVELLVAAAEFDGPVQWQTDRPVGVVDRSVSDRVLAGLGFACRYPLDAGLAETYSWYVANEASARH